MSAPSYDDYMLLGVAELVTRRPDLTAAEGDITDMQLASASAMADHITGYFAGRFKSTFLDGARDGDLSVLASDHYSVERDDAVESIGILTFAHVAGPTGTIPAGTRGATQPDAQGDFQEFVTLIDLVFTAGDAALTVVAQASVGGRTGNVGLHTIDRLLDPPAFDPTFTVTNVDAFIGGDEEQTDQSIVDEVRGINRTLRKAIVEALEEGARKVSTVKFATAVVDIDTGIVAVYVSDVDGNSNATMVAAVDAEMVNWQAAGVSVSIIGASLVAQPIDFSLTVKAGVDAAVLVDLARAAVVGLVNRGRAGETLHRTDIRYAAKRVAPDSITTVVVNVPAADVAPTPSQIIRADMSTTTAS